MFQHKNVKNLIIDLGGVVIRLKRERAVDELISLGIEDADTLLGLYRQEPPFLSLETGEITAGEFYDTLRARAGNSVSDLRWQEAFNAFLVDLPVERLEALRVARKAGFRLFVLSNTNPVMFNSWIARAFRAEGLTINDYFDGVVTSFSEGCCKPDERIFRIVLERYALKPEETVMLDDSEANCRAAEQTGMQSLHIGSDEAPDLIRALELISSHSGK